MTAMNADETKLAGMPQGAEEEQEPEREQKKESDGAAAAAGVQCDPDSRIVAPPPRQRTLTRTAELDADCEDIELDADDGLDDAADSITLELALSPHSSATPTPSPTTADEDFAQLDNSKPFKVGIPLATRTSFMSFVAFSHATWRPVIWASISLSDYCGAIVTLDGYIVKKNRKN